VKYVADAGTYQKVSAADLRRRKLFAAGSCVRINALKEKGETKDTLGDNG
jgi:hypothetical protein